MRAFLESVQVITTAVGKQDMPTIASAARKVGTAAQQAVPSSLAGKLPLSFKRLGFDTHKQFDTIALDAEDLGEPDHALQQLSVLMQNCVACHAAYRIDVKTE
jgi:cytochrome c556